MWIEGCLDMPTIMTVASRGCSAGLRPAKLHALAYDKPLCASPGGFTRHAATRAGGLDAEGREALLRYVLRPPIAQERVEPRPDGLVRITLKKAYADGTVAVDLDPLSLLCRMATSVPPPRLHTIHYAGVLAAASPWRSRVSAQPPLGEPLVCPSCQGRMKLLAVVKNPATIARYLAAAGELTDVPSRAPGRGPP
jgi:hypothetical protein